MKHKLTVVAASFALMFAAGAHAQDSSKKQASPKAQIEQQHKAAMDKCNSMKGNAKDICKAEADGQKKIAEAQQKVAMHDTPKNRLDLEQTKADAQYKVAKERCDDQVGDAKSACQKEAKATRDMAKAQAKQQSQTQTQVSGSSGARGTGVTGAAASGSAGTLPAPEPSASPAPGK